MALAPKPISLTQIDTGDYDSPLAPAPFVVVGPIPTSNAQPAPAIDATPADATAVATNLQAVVTALIAAGVFTAG